MVLLICGVVCALSGIVIIATSIYETASAPYIYYTLGGINIFNGVIFLFLLRKNRV